MTPHKTMRTLRTSHQSIDIERDLTGRCHEIRLLLVGVKSILERVRLAAQASGDESTQRDTEHGLITLGQAMSRTRTLAQDIEAAIL